MKNTWIKTLSALAIAAAIPFTAHADSDHRSNGQRDAEIFKTFGLISAEQAREIALKEFPGVVTELELDDPNAPVFELPETGPTVKSGLHYLLAVLLPVLPQWPAAGFSDTQLS